ncbi:MAG: hydroxysqualene dehydroxylase HpnE [Bryobacteraceae bacterium]|nr:hydroxysqualene dehydroxylase HpnE [Bryobacteraceae bacterium]
MARVAIAGAGLAGISAAAALAQAGHEAALLEARPAPGGRASSIALPGSGEIIDNCQHILLKCCVNLLDLYRRLGVEGLIEFHRKFFYVEPGGRTSVFGAGLLPAPLHFAGSFARLRFLTPAEKLEAARGLAALLGEAGRRKDLDSLPMQAWLEEKRQSRRVVERFWAPVLVSAINEELDRMAASHGFQVFRVAFFGAKDAYQMGVPRVPLGELCSAERLARIPGLEIRLRTRVTGIAFDEGGGVRAFLTESGPVEADAFICALPFPALRALLPEAVPDWDAFRHSPIAGIHLWFDRPITELPHAVLLDSPYQWLFNKREGRQVQLVVSAARFLLEWPRERILREAVEDLKRYFPAAARAELERAHVVREVRATFSAAPGLEAKRPRAETRWPNLFLAGEWTQTGWPSTMEGAVRSGYRAAEAVCRLLGESRRFVLPDIA